MKQVLLLEKEDFARLKSGEMIELRPGLLLGAAGKGAETRRAPDKPVAGETRDERRRRLKREYMKRWHAKHPDYERSRKRKPVKLAEVRHAN
jgi:hypothetical protein